ncbi:MAG: Shedu immune nuclease family protein [Fimbriiglobus sp.]
MAAVLEPIVFNPHQFEKELLAFEGLLTSKVELAERADIQSLFKASRHLSAFLGTFEPEIGPATELAFEFPFFGDYKADLLIGRKSVSHFCIVEFEEGGSDSIFKRQPNRANPEWSAKFEHGFSQIVDWYFSLDDYKKTAGFMRTFGHGHIAFTGLLVIGRSEKLDDTKRHRLRWRSGKVLIDSQAVACITFDELFASMKTKYSYYQAAAAIEK